MNMVRSPSSVGSTYTGPLAFLDNQTSFYNIFGLDPDMLLVIARSSYAIEESVTLRSKNSTLCSGSQLHISCNIVQNQYVGTETYDSNQMISDISFALSNLKLEFQYKGKNISLTPDYLYRCYIQCLPLLPSNATT